METVETEELRKYCVYLITNLMNGKRYGGFTHRPKQRWWEHKSKARKGVKKYLYSDMRLYGEGSFRFEVLKEGLTRKEANDSEIRLIEDLQLTNSKLGYNESPGGEGGPLTEEIITKICESRGMKKDSLCGNRFYVVELPTADLIREYKEGKSTPELAKKYGCDSATVGKRLKDAGVILRSATERGKLLASKDSWGLLGHLPNNTGSKRTESTKKKMRESNKQRRRDVSDEEVVKLYSEGKSSPQIAAIFGMTHPTIQRRLRLNGIQLRPPGRHDGRSRQN